MPELPEVETIVRELRPQLVGRRIQAVKASRKRLRRPWRRSWAALILGRSIHDLSRRGKWIRIGLEGENSLVIHLGMTGQLVVVNRNAPARPHTHLVFDLDNDEQLRFRDVRRFGSATLLDDPAACACFFADAGLGPEPFVLEDAYWQERLAATRRVLKAILLDQGVVAGVGNIYADEALFEARLHPARTGPSLDRREARRLRRAIVTVLNRAIDKRGSSIRDYIGGSGREGSYQREFRVYGQTGKPCPRCRQPIRCIRLAGRATHFCGGCQPET